MPAERKAPMGRWAWELVVLGGADRREVVARAGALRRRLGEGRPVRLRDLAATVNRSLAPGQRRLAIVASSVEDLGGKLDHALERLADPERTRIREISGIHYAERPLAAEGRLALLFPGEGAQYPGMLADLCLHFPRLRRWFDLMDRVSCNRGRSPLPSQAVFAGAEDGSEDELWRMDVGTEAVFAGNQGLHALLEALGVRGDAIVGHSTGEYSALLASGAVHADHGALADHVADLNGVYEGELGDGRIAPAALVAAGGVPADRVREVVDGSNGALHLAMDNCPHQAVLCGSRAEVDAAAGELRAAGGMVSELPFDRAYHTPLFEPFTAPLREFFDRLEVSEPRVPLWSAVTAERFPSDPVEIRALAASQYARPVRFRETIERMHDDGMRLFVEAGPRGNLSGFVDDTLRRRPHLAIAANLAHRPGLLQLHHALAELAAHGVDMSLAPLYERRRVEEVRLEDHERPAAGRAMRLSLGLPVLEVSRRAGGAPGPGQSTRAAVGAAASVATSGQAPAPAAGADQSGPGGDGEAGDRDQAAADGDCSSRGDSNRGAPGERDRAVAVERHLATMSRFLATQEEVLNAYLKGARATGEPGPSATPPPLEPPRPPVAPAPAGVPAPAASSSPQPPQPVLASEPGKRPPSQAVTEPPAARAPATAGTRTAPADGPTAERIRAALAEIVSDRTGYPPEMLDPGLDLEADLGIDSIKRIETLGALERQIGMPKPDQVEQVSRLKTLDQVAAFLGGETGEPMSLDAEAAVPLDAEHQAPPRNRHESAAAAEHARPPDAGHAAPPGPRHASSGALPLAGTTTRLVEGRELVWRCRMSLEGEPFLRDHTLGTGISAEDRELGGLPVMPLTMTLELAAEAALALAPGHVVARLEGARAHSWITVERGAVELEVSATRSESKGASDELAFEVEVRDVGEEVSLGPPALEASVVCTATRSEPPVARTDALSEPGASRWTPERIYTEGMFNGPAFRAVASVERCAADGAEATLRGMPRDGLLAAERDPAFVADPVALDGAGQVVGLWAAERYDAGFVVFPFAVDRVELFGAALEAGETAQVRAFIAEQGEDSLVSDIEVTGSDGRLHARLTGWRDRRFAVSREFAAFVLDPGECFPSRSWEAPLAALPPDEGWVCRRCASDEPALAELNSPFWEKVLAFLVLGPRERETWLSLGRSRRRRREWLLGRIAAKDAVRAYARAAAGVLPWPADVEIVPEGEGRPTAAGRWVERVGHAPALSVAHSEGAALAVCGGRADRLGLGVDIEGVRRLADDVRSAAFAPDELERIEPLHGDDRAEWALRLWCAKEAAGKALGRGLGGSPRQLRVRSADPFTGRAEIMTASDPNGTRPKGAASRNATGGGNAGGEGAPIVVHTLVEDGLAVATAIVARTPAEDGFAVGPSTGEES